MARLEPIGYDPFAQQAAAPRLEPIGYDPFAKAQQAAAPILEPVDYDPFAKSVAVGAPSSPSEVQAAAQAPRELPQLTPPPFQQFAETSVAQLPSLSQIGEQAALIAEPLLQAPGEAARTFRQYTDYARQGLNQMQQPGFHNLVAGAAKGALGELGAIPAALGSLVGGVGGAVGRLGEATGYGVGPFEGAHPALMSSLAPSVGLLRRTGVSRAADNVAPPKLGATGELAQPQAGPPPLSKPPALPDAAPQAPQGLPGATPLRETPKQIEARIEAAYPSPLSEVGAARAPVPTKISRTGALEAEHELRLRLVTKPQAYLEEERQFLNSVPQHLRDPKIAEELYQAYEKNSVAGLSSEAQALHKVVGPKKAQYEAGLTRVNEMRKQLALTDEEAVELGFSLTGAPRMRLDKAKFVQAASEGTPLSRHALSDAPSLHSTKYETLVTPEGQRLVVSKGPKNLTVLDTGKAIPGAEGLKYGDKVSHKGIEYTYDRARAGEIEAALSRKSGGAERLYLQDPSIVYAYSNAAIRTAEQRLIALDKLKRHLDTAPFISGVERRGWVKSQFPGLKNQYIHPRVNEILEDFTAKSRTGSLWENIEDASHWLTSTIFLTGGLPHLLNVGAHSAMAAGWTLFDPRYFGRNWGRAWDDVRTGSELYRRVMKEGGPLFFAPVRNQTFARYFMKKFGHDIKKDPVGTGLEAWAKNAGVSAKDAYNAYARNMNAGLWFGGDVIAMQRIRQFLDRGYSLKEALAKVKDIPDYVVPSRVWEGFGGRAATKFLRYTPLNVFGRYHYNIAHGFGKLAKDTAVGTKAQRIDAVGRAMALAALYSAYKFRDALLEEGPKDARGRGKYEPIYHGPLGVMKTAEGWLTGENRSNTELARAFGASASPLVSLGTGLLSGVDFANRPIVRPGASFGEAAAQRADFATQAISPVGQFFGGPVDQSMTEPLERVLLGLRKRPPPGGWGALPFQGKRPVGAIEALTTGREWGGKPKAEKKPREARKRAAR